MHLMFYDRLYSTIYFITSRNILNEKLNDVFLKKNKLLNLRIHPNLVSHIKKKNCDPNLCTDAAHNKAIKGPSCTSPHNKAI